MRDVSPRVARVHDDCVRSRQLIRMNIGYCVGVSKPNRVYTGAPIGDACRLNVVTPRRSPSSTTRRVSAAP
jgi:hypothetical protein